MQTKNNKLFLDKVWAKKFLDKHLKKYWPKAKKIVSLKIELIKVFLDYLRFTVRYRVSIETKKGRIENRAVIIKTERAKKFDWPPRIGKVQRDFLATSFLGHHGLKGSLPRPLEFHKPLKAYLYEEANGEPLKNFIQSEKWRVSLFYKKIPDVAKILKKLHSIKRRPSFAPGNPKKLIEDGLQKWFNVISKYYPAGKERAEKIIAILKKMEKKYKNIIFDRKSYRVTHGDFQNDNILVGPKREITLIDFADCKFFNPLDDLASFLIQSESHFKYVKPKNYKKLTSKLKKTIYSSYFGRKIKPMEEMQIEFFSAKDILRIITFVSFTQKNWQTINDHSQMMDNLLSFAEEKVKNLETKYL
jgi:thiamine kinase-like enzyme